MSDFKQENHATRKALALPQGKMGTILERLQTQRDNVAVINQADATIVTSTADTTLAMMDLTDPVVQPGTISQPLSQTCPIRFAAAYPWGILHKYNPQFATRNPFMSYQSYVTASANMNGAFSWGMSKPYSAQGVETK